ncbi:MAG: protein kinase [candidate division WOR-3 bacterium]
MLKPKQIISNRYEIERYITSGGFANVYKGLDIKLYNRPVAIKQLKREYGENSTVLRMWQSEITLSSKLMHSNIVQIYDTFKDNEDYYVVLEFIDGVDLRKLIVLSNENKQKIPSHLAAYIIYEVCNALEYAHNLRDEKTQEPLYIVHRDVSPQNILLSNTGMVKITDFGIAKARVIDQDETRTGIAKGKQHYMSPEQILGQRVDQTSDLYSLGIVMYETLTGERLYNASTDFQLMQMVAKGGIGKRELDKVHAPIEYKKILTKALEVDKVKRYQEAKEMKRDLNKLLLRYDNLPGELEQFIMETTQKKKQNENLELTATITLTETEQQSGSEFIPVAAGEKTEIDIVRYVGYSFKKVFITTILILLIFVVGFLVVDTWVGLTPISKVIRNKIWPPLVEIRTIPENALVIIDDIMLEERTPLVISSITPGDHILKLKLEGYRTIETKINVKDKETKKREGKAVNSFTYNFEVPIIVNSTPPGAIVYINNSIWPEKTPTEIIWKVSNKNATIKLSYPDLNLKPLECSVNLLTDEFLSNNAEFLTFQKENESEIKYIISGTFYSEHNIEVVPKDAEITINNKYVPIQGEVTTVILPYGNNIVTASKPGFNTKSRTISVTDGVKRTTKITLSRNISFHVRNRFNGNPIVNAYVNVKGNTYNTSELVEVLAELQNVTITAKGYYSKRIEIDPISNTTFTVDLEPMTSVELRFVSQDGTPVESLRIFFTYENSFPEQIGITDRNGYIRIDNYMEHRFTEGTYEISADKVIGYETQSYECVPATIRIEKGINNIKTIYVYTK